MADTLFAAEYISGPPDPIIISGSTDLNQQITYDVEYTGIECIVVCASQNLDISVPVSTDVSTTLAISIVVVPSHMGADPIVDTTTITVEDISEGWFRENIHRLIPSKWLTADTTGEMDTLIHGLFATTFDEIKQLVNSVLDVIDLDYCPARYLRTIAAFLNWPLNDRDSVSSQRRQLKMAVELYRRKGTIDSFKSMMRFFGFDVDVVPLWSAEDPEGEYGIYETFAEEIPAGESEISSGGKWFPSPHFGIRLNAIIGLSDFFDYGEAEVNKIKNGSFELSTGAPNYTPDWYPWYVPGVFSGSREITLDNAYEASKSAKVTTTTLESSPAFSQSFDTTVGGTYDLTFAGLGSAFKIEVWDDTQSGVILATGTHAVTSEWLVTTVTFQASSPETRIEIRPTETGTFYVDDIKIYRHISEVPVRLFLDEPSVKYILSRIHQVRPAFTVLEWLALHIDLWDYYQLKSDEVIVTVAPTIIEPGWPMGLCVPPEPQYTRNDERLLGDYLIVGNTVPPPPTQTDWENMVSSETDGPPYNREYSSGVSWSIYWATVIDLKRNPRTWYFCNPVEEISFRGKMMLNEAPLERPLYRDGMGLYPVSEYPTPPTNILQYEWPSRGWETAGGDVMILHPFYRLEGTTDKPLETLFVTVTNV